MVYCALFKDINSQMVSEVGIKALNLAELYNRTFPVPKGFVIKSRALNDFLIKNKLVEPINNILENIDLNNYSALLDASKKISEIIMAGRMPEILSDKISSTYKNLNVSEDMSGLNDAAKNMINAGRGDVYVAVRSSAVINGSKSVPGLHSSQLNILGTPALIKAVLECFCSFYSPAAIYYYKKNNVRSPELAIIVQEMIISEKSGVLSTVNPITNNLTEFVIEGSYGLGESVAKGEVTPDRYTINIQNGTLGEVKVNKKSSMIIIDPLNGGTKKERVITDQVNASLLSTNEIKVLTEIADKIQVHFNHPQDIEWAISKRRVHILQSIPIQNVSVQHDQVSEAQENRDAICSGTGTNLINTDGEVRIINSSFELSNIKNNNIIVTSSASIDMLPVFGSVRGVITNNGGVLSNLAKMSRDMKIPMIVGTYDATMKLQNASNVMMDSRSGNIYEKTDRIQNEPVAVDKSNSVVETSDDEEPIIATKIRLNVYGEQNYDTIKESSDGVGYMSLDMSGNATVLHDNMNGFKNTSDMNQNRDVTPTNSVLKTIDSFYPKSVWLKTTEFSDPNFKNQLIELKMIIDKGYNNVGVMFPGIHHQLYINKIMEMSESIGLNLSSIEYGISVDTSAACILCEEISNTGIKFISIDFEKLVRNTLGLSQDEKITNHDMHPAVLKLIRTCVWNYHKKKIHTSIHGRSITNQHFVEKLIEFHIDSISVNKSAFKMLKYVAARTEKKMLLDIMMHRSDSRYND